MPELPEVETVMRGLAAVLQGHRLAEVEVRRADLRSAAPICASPSPPTLPAGPREGACSPSAAGRNTC